MRHRAETGTTAGPYGLAPMTAAGSDRAGAPARRASGILLHITSLSGRRLGPAAREFVDWLAAAGQSWWQILPLAPPDRSGSPYAGRSAFAGWRGLLADPAAPVAASEEEAFRERHAYWIAGWARHASPGAIADQVRFEREWRALRDYAAAQGVGIIGDLPFYVGPHGADPETWPDQFRRGVVSGAPPDAFSATGQLWNTPMYDWPAMRADGYRWWVERLRRAFELHDVVRLDHFRAFLAGWEVVAGAADASGGRWRAGPGGAPLVAAEAELGPLEMICEDLGVITRPVRALRERLGMPGMRVLQFGFAGGSRNPHRIAAHPVDSVVYTGTHDHDTLRGWWDGADPAMRRSAARALRVAGIDDPDPARALVRLALSSRARLAIIPMQDVLGLGSETRMNTPATTAGNWSWRLRADQLRDADADRLRAVTQATDRLVQGDGPP